jgi:hypothetical protein
MPTAFHPMMRTICMSSWNTFANSPLVRTFPFDCSLEKTPTKREKCDRNDKDCGAPPDYNGYDWADKAPPGSR